MWRLFACLWIVLIDPVAAEAPPSPPRTETVQEALCRLIESSARTHGLPASFLTRLIWRESSFRVSVVSPAGAQGVAQFMPGTAVERGLADPFDPEQAIPKAADLLSSHRQRFGNLGLAAAAYNGGPNRVSAWLEARGGLPYETREFVERITGRSAEDWAEDRKAGKDESAAPRPDEPSGCMAIVALLRRPGGDGLEASAAPVAPWGVQLAGNFSKDRALAAFGRARRSYSSVLEGVTPMIIGTRLRSRGTRAFYRVRVPAQTRTAALSLCERIRAAGGSCIVLPS